MTSQVNALNMKTNLDLISSAYKKESRSFCPQCEFLKARCLCNTLKPINNKIHIIILQHKSETKHALNTARILVKGLQNVTLLIGEDFTQNEELNQILNHADNRCGLIFPTDKAVVLNAESKKEITKLTHLILIDGTWRKAKKVFLLSNNLQSLMAMRLVPESQSHYRIRKGPNVDGLSTLEAAVTALGVLEPELNCDSLNLSFKKMIDWQIEQMGEDVYKKNYTDKRLEQH